MKNEMLKIIIGIQEKTRIKVFYKNKKRIIEPHRIFISTTDNILVRAYELETCLFKLYDLKFIDKIEILDEHFNQRGQFNRLKPDPLMKELIAQIS